MSEPINRRNLVKYGLAGLGAFALGHWRLPIPLLEGPHEASAKSGPSSGKVGSSSSQSSTLFGYRPFSQPLFIPAIAQARPRGALSPAPGQYERDGQLNGKPRTPRGNFNDVAHGIAPEFDGRVPGFPCPDWNRFPAMPTKKNIASSSRKPSTRFPWTLHPDFCLSRRLREQLGRTNTWTDLPDALPRTGRGPVRESPHENPGPYQYNRSRYRSLGPSPWLPCSIPCGRHAGLLYFGR